MLDQQLIEKIFVGMGRPESLRDVLCFFDDYCEFKDIFGQGLGKLLLQESYNSWVETHNLIRNMTACMRNTHCQIMQWNATVTVCNTSEINSSAKTLEGYTVVQHKHDLIFQWISFFHYTFPLSSPEHTPEIFGIPGMPPTGAASPSGHKKILDFLTARELQILSLWICGYSAKETARQLEISHRTIEQHRDNIRNKFGVHTKGQLFDLLRNHNLLEVLIEMAAQILGGLSLGV